MEDYRKQLSSRKFKLFSLNKQTNAQGFYKFENVSNPDSVMLSARSGRLSNLEYTDNPYTDAAAVVNMGENNARPLGMRSLRESLKNS